MTWFRKREGSVLKLNCLVCSKEFERYRSEVNKSKKHYCSIDCQRKDKYCRIGSNHHNYNHITRKCEKCDQEFSDTAYKIKNGRRFCSYICSNSFKRILDPESYSYNHRTARMIFTTLKHIDKCEICGIKQSIKIHNNKHELIIHHRDGNMKNNVIDNLQVMCRQCHSRHHFTKQFPSGIIN